MPVEDEVVGIRNETDPGITDSWGNRTWRDEEQPAFTDRTI